MSDGRLSRDERTTPIGLYHFADSYRAAAIILSREFAGNLATHPDVPQEFLLIHSIELYLKSYLRLKGYSLDQIKNELGHSYSKLAEHFEKHGGSLNDHDRAVIELLTPENVFGTRYIVVGAARVATKEGLVLCANHLHEIVRDALKAAGGFVR
jgi:hypothetical protein